MVELLIVNQLDQRFSTPRSGLLFIVSEFLIFFNDQKHFLESRPSMLSIVEKRNSNYNLVFFESVSPISLVIIDIKLAGISN